MLRSEVSPDFIPVDVPINLMIVAAWSVAGATSKTKQIPVVQIMMLKADDDDADPQDNLIEGVQLHLQPRQGQDLGRVAAVDSQLAQVGLQSFPSSGSLYVSHRYNPPHHFHRSSSSLSGLFPSSRRLDILSPVSNLIFCHIVCARYSEVRQLS